MAYVPLSRFLFRAPLMSVGQSSAEELLAHPLGKDAIAIASPELASALTRDGWHGGGRPPVAKSRSGKASASAMALRRYARRAAFRPTPSGWLAGVGLGELGPRMRVATGEPRGTGRIAWARLKALARALLSDAGVRARTRLRLGPSVIVSGDRVIWLGPGDSGGFVTEARTGVDEVVGAVLEVAADWTPWTTVRRAVIAALQPEAEVSNEGDEDDEDEDEAFSDSIDDVLLTMVDDGFLHSDLVAPLVGPIPSTWMDQRLASLSSGGTVAGVDGDLVNGDFAELRARLSAAALESAQGHCSTAAAILATLPEHVATGRRRGDDPAIDAVLRFGDPARAKASAPVTLPVGIVNRACGLVPILFRLQEAMSPPVRERAPSTAMADALDAVTELYGAGAFDLGGLATGEYGVATGPERGLDDALGDGTAGGDGGSPCDEDPAGGESESAPGGETPPPTELLTLVIDRIAAAARGGAIEIELSAELLDRVLPPGDAPATCELFLTPCAAAVGGTRKRKPRAKTGSAAKAGWLLGLHAPAGATWGRFAHSLADDERRALFGSLVAAERESRPGERHLDVVFAPDAALADLCTHPPLRNGALALTHWPAEDSSSSSDGGYSVVTAPDVQLVAEPAAAEPLSVRHDSTSIVPSPFHRVRSTTAPPGIWRLLTGWSLCRQHRPWAMQWGPLGDLEFLPRVWLDGFVIAPASWRIPADIARPGEAKPETGAAERGRAAAAAWRTRAGVPRHVQVGREDELLPVDLDSSDASADLRGHDRVFEIWPPRGDTPDAQGRRIEAVIALVDRPTPSDRERLQATWARVAETGPVAPPHRRRDGEEDPGAGWTTVKLFGLAEMQNALLAEVVAPAIASAQAAGDLSSWFFQRYVEPPGRRAHLRVRVQGDAEAVGASLESHMAATLARDRLLVASIERAPYFPEAARYGGAECLPAIHRLFEADSELVCACLGRADGEHSEPGENGDPPEAVGGGNPLLFCLIRAFDALARGLGCDAKTRRALAASRRHAHADQVDAELSEAWATGYRRARPRLRAFLSGEASRAVESAFAVHEAAVSSVAEHLRPETRDRILPALLHVCAVRWLGPHRRPEIQAYTYWERALDSLAHHKASPARNRS